MNSVGPILEKLSSDRLYKASINAIWKSIKQHYLENFQMLPYLSVVIPNDVKDIGGGRAIFKTNYSFEKDKRVVVKEPYIIFCISTDNLSLSWRGDEATEKSYFLSTISNGLVTYRNTLWVERLEKAKPEILEFIYKIFPEYRDNPDLSFDYRDRRYVQDELEKSVLGQELWERAFSDYFSKVLNSPQKREFHEISWLSHTLMPMFIWDTEVNLIYTCGTEYYSFKKLDRRTLGSKNFSNMRYEDFLVGKSFVLNTNSAVGFPTWLDNPDLVLD